MPILRHGLRSGGEGDFLMAFVTMPGLRVEASRQRDQHVRSTDAGAVVRYLSRDGDFTAELELDEGGLVELIRAWRALWSPARGFTPLP